MTIAESLDAVEECMEHLRHVYSPEGVIEWFKRPRKQLDGRTPIEAINGGDHEQVVALAKSSRESVAT